MRTNAQIFSIFYRLSPSLGPPPKKIVATSHTEKKTKEKLRRRCRRSQRHACEARFWQPISRPLPLPKFLVHSLAAIPPIKSEPFNRIENPFTKDTKVRGLPALAMICAMEEIALSLTSWSRSAALRRRRVEA